MSKNDFCNLAVEKYLIIFHYQGMYKKSSNFRPTVNILFNDIFLINIHTKPNGKKAKYEVREMNLFIEWT